MREGRRRSSLRSSRSPPALDISAPRGWDAAVSEDGELLTFTAVEPAPSLPGSEDDGNVPPSPFQIKPGQTLNGFSFLSFDPPAAVEFFAQAYAPLPALDVDDPASAMPPGSLGNFFRGATRGPLRDIDDNHIDDGTFFVRQHYRDFLNREPDSGGHRFWINEITSCGTDAGCREVKRINVSAAFFLAIEFQQTGYLAYRAHKAAFGDLAGKPVPITQGEMLASMWQIGQGVRVGIGDWQQQLEQNKRLFFDSLVAGERFAALYPQSMSPAQFVAELNRNAGGALSQAERDALISALQSATKTRAQVLREVAEDADLVRAEFNKAFVLMQYFGYLRRDPDDTDFRGVPDPNFEGYHFWLGKLNDFNGNFVQAEMVKAFISSIEYRQRFGK